MPPIRLILADDHQMVRAGLRMLLQTQADMEIVAEASSGQEAIELACRHEPDIVLMDVTMPDVNGMEATRELKGRCPKVRILALTIHEEEDYLFQMLEAGASGYIPKRAAPEDLIQAIHSVYRGEVFLHSSVASALVQDFLHRGEAPEEEELAALTPRELEVLIWIARGLTNKEIGERLGISPKTVAHHRDNVCKKLNLSNRAEMTRYAIRKGLIDLTD